MQLFRLMALSVMLGGGAIATMLLTRSPSNDRPWALDHARLPRITVTDSIVRIDDVRRFRFRSVDDFEPNWVNATYDLRRLESVWFILAPFSKGWRGPAHAFVSFGFSDSTYVGISIEARRERDETYGIFRGMGRNFELIYVIGDEADLIGRRALADADVYVYPVHTTPQNARALFIDMLTRAEQLRNTPEFYNTLSNSCTSELVRHVNQVAPGRIPAGLKLLLPGYADDVARSLGLIDGRQSIDSARLRYRANERGRAHLNDPRFSIRIRT